MEHRPGFNNSVVVWVIGGRADIIYSPGDCFEYVIDGDDIKCGNKNAIAALLEVQERFGFLMDVEVPEEAS